MHKTLHTGQNMTGLREKQEQKKMSRLEDNKPHYTQTLRQISSCKEYMVCFTDHNISRLLGKCIHLEAVREKEKEGPGIGT